MPRSGLGTSTFAAAVDILDFGKLAGDANAAPLISIYIQSVAAGEYTVSAITGPCAACVAGPH
jgi:hypothetical protein